METKIKAGQLTSNNLDINNLEDNLRSIIRNKRYSYKEVKKEEPVEASTTYGDGSTYGDDSTLTEEDDYIVPYLSIEVINSLGCVKDGRRITVYNKQFPLDTFNNKPLFFITKNNRTIYCYGYKPTNYKYIDKNFNCLYFASNFPFALYCINPLTVEMFHILSSNLNLI